MELNPIIDKFYLSILKYAGLEYKDSIIVNIDNRLGDITIDNKHITLPYYSNLKNPNNRLIFHLLNENYTNPENSLFNLFRKRLVLEINLKFSSLIISLISLAADPQLQQKIKNPKLIELVSNIGEVDYPSIEHFLNIVKASKKVNEEAFIFDVFLKKNGNINDTPYAAIGKVNFVLYNELQRSLENPKDGYKVYGYKARKKDILAYINIFNAIFPDINNKDNYIEGTDNRIFRYLGILLKTTYIVAKTINNIAELLLELKEPILNAEEIISDLEWSNYLEQLYGMANEIRLIPNQVDITIEANKLKVNESKAKEAEQHNKQEFNPNMVPNQSIQQPTQQVNQPLQQPMQQANQTLQQPMQPQQQTQLTPEEIIRNSLNTNQSVQPMVMSPMVAQPMLQPMLQQTYIPTWVQQEAMANQANSQTQQFVQPMPMQPMPMQPVQPMPMQPMMQPMQPMMQPMHPNTIIQSNMPNQYQQQGGLQLNPHFINQPNSPWR